MGPGVGSAMALAMMGSGTDEEGQSDPRTRLMQAMMLNNATGGTGQGDGEDETGGEVGKRHLDISAGNVNAQPQPQSTPEDDLESHRNISSRLATIAGARQQGALGEDEALENRPLPTTFPATATKDAAYQRLQKAESDPRVQPLSGGKKILSAVMGAIPIVGPAYHGMERMEFGRGQRDITNARDDYKTQAQLEEDQRQQALREKIAQSNLSVNKALKTLTLGMQAHKTDVQQEIGEGRNQVQAAGKGYDLHTDPNSGHQTVTAKPVMDLSEVQRRSLEVQQATEDLKKAQTLAVPEQVEIKKKALDLANSRLSEYLQNTQFHQDLAREGMDFREGGPTTQMRDRSQQANVIDQTGQQLIKDITAGASNLGPIMGRVGSLTDFIGNPPPEYAKLASEITTYIALQPAAHGFRGMRAVQEFEKSIGTPIRTPEALIAAIQGNMQGLKPMAGAGSWTPPVRATPQSQSGGEVASPSSTLKKKAPGKSGGQTPSSTRTVTRDAKGNLTFAQ